LRQLTLTVLAASAIALTGGRAMAFDARNPPDVLAVIQGDGAAGAIKIDKNGAPWIDGKVGKLGFEVDFTGCDAHGLNCKRAFYAMAFDMSSITLDQINGWNRSSIVCPAYLTTANHPRVWYGLIPSAADTPVSVKGQFDAWLGCMTDFDKFTDGPDAFLKAS
jgi:hypothetical protein